MNRHNRGAEDVAVSISIAKLFRLESLSFLISAKFLLRFFMRVLKAVPVAVFSVEIFFALVSEKKMPAGFARGLAKVGIGIWSWYRFDFADVW